MKVVSKFAVAFFVASVLCLAVFAYVLANREAARLDRVLRGSLETYAEGLRPALETTWREHGYVAAARIVEGLDAKGGVRATLAREAPAGAVPAPDATTAGAPAVGHVVRVHVDVVGPGGERARLALERSGVDGATIAWEEASDQLLTAGALAIVMVALAALLGALVIGGPLERIVLQARRIGAGDFSQRLRAEGNDEIGALKRELNVMCDRLEEATARLDEEATARVETLEKLRHLDRLRTVGTIASGIAHELGTPLNILLLRGQSLTRGDVERAEVADAGAAVVNQVQKMSRIVRQLLDFSRARAAPRAAEEEVDLGTVARHATSLLESMAKKQGVAIEIEVKEDEPVMVRGDFGQIEQALTNLIVNGVQAMPRGGTLRVRVRREGGGGASGVLEVIDEGEGLSEAVREVIFEPFFTTKLEGEGTGLGLHVARGIAQDHGGSIVVESEPGRGSTFALHLPRSA